MHDQKLLNMKQKSLLQGQKSIIYKIICDPGDPGLQKQSIHCMGQNY